MQSEMTACDQLDCAFAVKRDLDPAYAPDTGTPEIGGYPRTRRSACCAACAGSTWWAATWSRSRRRST